MIAGAGVCLDAKRPYSRSGTLARLSDAMYTPSGATFTFKSGVHFTLLWLTILGWPAPRSWVAGLGEGLALALRTRRRPGGGVTSGGSEARPRSAAGPELRGRMATR